MIKNTLPYTILRYLYGNHLSSKIIKQKLDFKNSLENKYKKNLEDLNQNGFTIIPNYYSSDEMSLFNQNILSELDKLDEQYHSTNSDDLTYFADNQKMVKRAHGVSRIMEIENFNPATKKFLEDPLIHQIISNYYGREAHFYHSTAQKTFPVKEVGLDWHIDDFFPRFKAMYYMKDAGPEDGPFAYLKGSHRFSWAKLKKIHKMYNENYAYGSLFTQEEVNRLPYEECRITAKAGDLILADVNGIHRGTPVKPGHLRYAVFAYYSPNRKPRLIK